MIAENARSVSHGDLPPVPVPAEEAAQGVETYAIVLFYQYKEPVWTDKEHKAALKKVISLGTYVYCVCVRVCVRDSLCVSLRIFLALTNPPPLHSLAGEEHKIRGRGRVAPEGVNCTLSGTSQVRVFMCVCVFLSLSLSHKLTFPPAHSLFVTSASACELGTLCSTTQTLRSLTTFHRAKHSSPYLCEKHWSWLLMGWQASTRLR